MWTRLFSIYFSYGTAGFRAEAELLDSTVFRMGVLAALRSLHTCQCTGVMVTASHNPVKDNGVKLSDPEGGMLNIAWESRADRLANAHDAAAVCQVVDDIVEHEKIQVVSQRGLVLLARDTRPSGERLAKAASQGISSIAGVEAVDMGVLTTPQLHWLVRATNRGAPSTEEAYFKALASSYTLLSSLLPPSRTPLTSDKLKQPLLVDGASGVGALKAAALSPFVVSQALTMEVRNQPGCGGVLNKGMGADFVQKEQRAPEGFDPVQDIGKRCVSVDGDADRLVYFYFGGPVTSPQFHLLDGDKIAVLAASFIGEQLQILRGAQKNSIGLESGDGRAFYVHGYGMVTVGVVQTAYANGASTVFITEQLGLQVVRTPTGVKYLHEAALAFDIGVYFEANGHGTVLFREQFLEWLKGDMKDETTGGEVHRRAIKRLIALSEMVNQAVGDALSNILLVETVLHYRGWTIENWSRLYADLPSRQLKVKVADRRAIITTDAETRVVQPAGLQEAIDGEVGKHAQGRAFVRPSGTEDAVRVYAEAASRGAADSLAQAVALHLQRFAASGAA